MYTDLSFPSSSSNFPKKRVRADWQCGSGWPEDVFVYYSSFLQTGHEFQRTECCCQLSISSIPTFTACCSPKSSRVQPCLLELGFLCNWFPWYWTYKVELHTLPSAGTFPLAWCQSDGQESPIQQGTNSPTRVLGPPVSSSWSPPSLGD